MVSAAIPPDEAGRLAVLRSYAILDTPFEQDYDDLCRLAATICGTPIALISFVDADRQWFKAAVGLDERQTSRDIAFCAHAIWQSKVFEVPDASLDQRFFDNPLVTGSPDIRFYAGQPLITPGGQAVGTLCAIDTVPRTLTDRQREALDILSRQVVTHLELRRALADLKKLNDDKDLFFSIIAHDLRSPFSGLMGLIDLMHDAGTSLAPAEVSRYIGMLHESIHRVYGLSEDLLRWALLEQGKMTYHPEVLTVAVLLDEVLYPLAETLEAKGLRVEVGPVEGLELTGDRNMVETALRNVVSNAVKFTPTGGQIAVRAQAEGKGLRIEVVDTGPGIPARTLVELNAGHKVPSSPGTGGESGSGLGLVLARQFAARHGGRVEFESTLGQGTTVSLVFPN